MFLHNTILPGLLLKLNIGGDDANLVAGEYTDLKEGGDFKSPECLKLLDEADIVVTNPPFSEFGEYIRTLSEQNKTFLVVGNMNAISYKEIFPLIKNDKIWLGWRSLNKDMFFNVPDDYKIWLKENKKEGSAYKVIDGVVFGRIASVCWFTNLNHIKRHVSLLGNKRYDPDYYVKYDNYNAINVDKVSEIPVDYRGLMGVPITFLGKYNPDEFEIIGEANHGSDNQYDLFKPKINGKEKFKRLIIKRR